MNLKFIVTSDIHEVYQGESSQKILGKVVVNNLITRKIKLLGNEYDGWDLYLDDMLIDSMPQFKFNNKEAPFKWMINFIYTS